jgi:hypothetical protein
LAEPESSVEIPRERLVDAAHALFRLAETLDWKSYDPYDILLSPLAGRVPDRLPLLARLLLQLGRRSGVTLRRLLRVAPHEEPKALADFLRAAAILDRANEDWAGAHAELLSRRLIDAAVETPAGRGWGIQFPWVSRYGTMAAGAANVYTTTVACQALLDDHELSGREISLEAAASGTRFIRSGLGSFVHGGRQWLRYAAGSASPIVNVQASAASLFARLSRKLGDEELLAAADHAAEVVISAQRADGSWPYSVDDRGAFVDGFHTGFTLEGLVQYAGFRGGEGARAVSNAVDAGFAFFEEHLLTADGRPRGLADARPTADGQTVAQAIQTLLTRGTSEDKALARQIWVTAWNAKHVERPFPALRWSLGPIVVATAVLVQADGPPPSPVNA